MLKATDGQADTEKRLETMVANYVTVRDHIDETEELVKRALAPFKVKKEELAAELIKLMDAQGVEMVRTKGSGTLSALVRHTAALTDPDAFMDYVREHDLYELLDRRANQVACREHAKYHNGVLPPGVKINSVRYVGVRSK